MLTLFTGFAFCFVNRTVFVFAELLAFKNFSRRTYITIMLFIVSEFVMIKIRMAIAVVDFMEGGDPVLGGNLLLRERKD